MTRLASLKCIIHERVSISFMMMLYVYSCVCQVILQYSVQYLFLYCTCTVLEYVVSSRVSRVVS
jgi:hypothetical protein